MVKGRTTAKAIRIKIPIIIARIIIFLSEDATSFEHTVLAKITAVSPQTVFTGGSALTITGAGFSTTKSKNTVTVDGVTCDVTAATST